MHPVTAKEAITRSLKYKIVDGHILSYDSASYYSYKERSGPYP